MESMVTNVVIVVMEDIYRDEAKDEEGKQS